MIRTILLTLGLIFGTAANADLSITFDEGAPKDRFDISNRGTCDLDAFEITIDLSTSQGALFFDVTKTGKGIEVYQPFELVSAKKRIQDARIPTDGDTMVVLDVARLNKG